LKSAVEGGIFTKQGEDWVRGGGLGALGVREKNGVLHKGRTNLRGKKQKRERYSLLRANDEILEIEKESGE